MKKNVFVGLAGFVIVIGILLVVYKDKIPIWSEISVPVNQKKEETVLPNEYSEQVKIYLNAAVNNDWKTAEQVLTGEALESFQKNLTQFKSKGKYEITDMDLNLIGRATDQVLAGVRYVSVEPGSDERVSHILIAIDPKTKKIQQMFRSAPDWSRLTTDQLSEPVKSKAIDAVAKYLGQMQQASLLTDNKIKIEKPEIKPLMSSRAPYLVSLEASFVSAAVDRYKTRYLFLVEESDGDSWKVTDIKTLGRDKL